MSRMSKIAFDQSVEIRVFQVEILELKNSSRGSSACKSAESNMWYQCNNLKVRQKKRNYITPSVFVRHSQAENLVQIAETINNSRTFRLPTCYKVEWRGNFVTFSHFVCWHTGLSKWKSVKGDNADLLSYGTVETKQINKSTIHKMFWLSWMGGPIRRQFFKMALV